MDKFRAVASIPRRPAITGGGPSRSFRRLELLTVTAAVTLVAAAVAALVWLGIFNY